MHDASEHVTYGMGELRANLKNFDESVGKIKGRINTKHTIRGIWGTIGNNIITK